MVSKNIKRFLTKLSAILSFLLLVFVLVSNSHSADAPVPQNTFLKALSNENLSEEQRTFYITKFFKTVEGLDETRTPRFSALISDNSMPTDIAGAYYKVYYKDSDIVAFEEYDRNVLVSKTIIRPYYNLYTKFSKDKDNIEFAISYFDNDNSIKRKEVFSKSKVLIYFNLYYYNWMKKRARVDVHDAKGRLIYTTYYNYDKEGKLISVDRKKVNPYYSIPIPVPDDSEQMKLLMEQDQVKLKILSVKGIYNQDIKDYRITGKIINLSSFTIYDTYVSIDLYNANGELVDTVLGYPEHNLAQIEPGETIVFESAKTVRSFETARIYLHYRSTREGKIEYIGPTIVTAQTLNTNY